MPHSKRWMSLGLVVSFFLISPVGAKGEDRTPAQVLAEINAIVIPNFDPTQKGNREANNEHIKKVTPLFVRKSELTMELYQLDPDSDPVARLMLERWRRPSTRDDSKTESEIDNVLARSKNETLLANALFWRSIDRSNKARRKLKPIEAVLPAIDTFTTRFPHDPRGADLLYAYASLVQDTPGLPAKIEKRLVFEYPESQWAKLVLGKMRQPDSIGKLFELDFTDAIGGSPVTMKAFRGKVVVVDFWATWCGPCVAEMPKLKKLYETYHDRGVEFLGVSLDDPRQGGIDRLKAFVAKNAIPWPQYYQGQGWDSDFSTSWGIYAIPTIFVIDREGKVFSTAAEEKLETILPELLAKEPVGAR